MPADRSAAVEPIARYGSTGYRSFLEIAGSKLHSPHEGLLREVWRSEAELEFWGQVVQNLDPDTIADGVQTYQRIRNPGAMGSAEANREDTKRLARIGVAKWQYDEERKHHIRACATAV